MLSVVPDTLSGAFGWPPSSGDGAILESVRRSEIISGGGRRQRPRRLGGRGSRNCAVLHRLFLLPFGNICCYFAASSTAAALSFLSFYIRYILYLQTPNTLALPTSTCYFTATSCCRCCCPRVFFFTLLFDFGGFFFLNYCATKLLLLATTLHSLSRSPAFSLSSFLLTLSFSRTGVCDTKMIARACVRVRSLSPSHSHNHTSRKEGFFLFFSLLHPLTAARHHPGSSSFPCQPEHSGRMATRRGPSLFHESGHLCRSIREITNEKKNPHATDPNSLLLFRSFFFARFSHAHTHGHSGAAEEKKCCAHTHTHAQIFRPTLKRKIRLFSRLFRKLENPIRENRLYSARLFKLSP